jgi:glutathione synthase
MYSLRVQPNLKIMNVCFIMHPWKKSESDSTLAMIHECERGHTVAIATPANLTIRDVWLMPF